VPAPTPAVVEQLVQDPVAVEASPLQVPDASGDLVIGDGGADDLRTALPSDAAIEAEGQAFVAEGAKGDVDLTVVPLADGVQIVLGIDSPDAPTEYAFDLSRDGGVVPTLLDSGAVSLAGGSGEDMGLIEAPWAYDADGVAVPTRFEVRGSTLVQVVDHASGDVTYPVTADPSFKSCNAFMATCVTFTKGETRTIAHASVGAAGVGAFCGFIPNLIGKVACGVVVAPVYASMRGTFVSARDSGRCVEVKSARVPSTPRTRPAPRCKDLQRCARM